LSASSSARRSTSRPSRGGGGAPVRLDNHEAEVQPADCALDEDPVVRDAAWQTLAYAERCSSGGCRRAVLRGSGNTRYRNVRVAFGSDNAPWRGM
jgi:hypothetical protein